MGGIALSKTEEKERWIIKKNMSICMFAKEIGEHTVSKMYLLKLKFNINLKFTFQNVFLLYII